MDERSSPNDALNAEVWCRWNAGVGAYSRPRLWWTIRFRLSISLSLIFSTSIALDAMTDQFSTSGSNSDLSTKAISCNTLLSKGANTSIITSSYPAGGLTLVPFKILAFYDSCNDLAASIISSCQGIFIWAKLQAACNHPDSDPWTGMYRKARIIPARSAAALNGQHEHCLIPSTITHQCWALTTSVEQSVCVYKSTTIPDSDSSRGYRLRRMETMASFPVGYHDWGLDL